MGLTNVLLALKAAEELAGLARRAIEAGVDVSREEIDAVFAHTDTVDAEWAEVNRKAMEAGEAVNGNGK